MTRGTFVYICNGEVLSSLEFNGDMYLDGSGHGEDAVRTLISADDRSEFEEALVRFNNRHHNYPEDASVLYKADMSWIEKVNDKYYDRWFSDYLYIKNFGETPVTVGAQSNISPRKLKEVELNQGEILVLNFAEFLVHFSDTGEVIECSGDYTQGDIAVE